MSEALSGDNGAQEAGDSGTGLNRASAPPPRRSLRGKAALWGIAAAVAVAMALTVLYLSGATDAYIRSQFEGKMNRMGMSFSAESFKVRFFPIRVSIRKASFNDKVSGTKLVFVDEADLDLSLRDVWALRFGREIGIDSTEVRGAKVWVSFDENGNSNFSNVRMLEEEDAVKVTFRASRLSIKQSELLFDDRKRSISVETRDLAIDLSPQDSSAPDDLKKYDFGIAARNAFLDFGRKRLENVGLDMKGVIGQEGAVIEKAVLRTSAGEAALSGKLVGWESPEYEFGIESDLDMTRISEAFPMGTPLTGDGSFKGTLSGKGESLRIDGQLTSESLSAPNVAFKGLDLTAALDSRDGAYEANGRAVAQILALDDFKVDYLQMVGLIRGSGTDFKWLGDLQAAAAKTKSGTLAGLFIDDAVAEYNERQGYLSEFRTARATSYALDDLLINDIEVGNLLISSVDGRTGISTPGAKAGRLRTDTLGLTGIQSGRIVITDTAASTEIETDKLSSASGRIGGFDLRDLRSSNVSIVARGGVTGIRADALWAESTSSDGVATGRVEAKGLDVRDDSRGLSAASKNLQISWIETDSTVIGSLNVAGARLTIVKGTVEFRSDDFDAGEIKFPNDSVFAEGGRLTGVKVSKPLYILEPAGRYRATADMSLGSGLLGTLELGKAKASVSVTDEGVTVSDLSASVMDGELTGSASVAWSEDGRSSVRLGFRDLDVSKALAVQGGRLMPLDGHAMGKAEVEFRGTDWTTATGRLEAEIQAVTGHGGSGMFPIAGRIELSGTAGLFEVETARLRTAASSLDGQGLVDLRGDSGKLSLAVGSADAGEIERILRSFEFSADVRRYMDEYRVELDGNLDFRGELSGNFFNPVLDAGTRIESVGIRGRRLGALDVRLVRSPESLELRTGVLTEADGGTLTFDVFVPAVGENNVSVTARLRDIDIGNILSAMPFDAPRALKELKADTSGLVDLKGLPDSMEGDASLTARDASLGAESFDLLEARLKFAGTLVSLDSVKAVFGKGFAEVRGRYATDSTDFEITATGSDVPLNRLRALFTNPTAVPTVKGTLSLTGRGTGRLSDSTSYDLEFNGTGKDVAVRDGRVGGIDFSGKTRDRILAVRLEARDGPGRQTIEGTVDFGDPMAAFEAVASFDRTSLDPYIAVFRESSDIPITGRASGRVEFKGNLFAADEKGVTAFNPQKLTGRARFSQFEIQIDETPLSAVGGVDVALTDNEIIFEKAVFAGGGSNLEISGVKALSGSVENNVSVVGRVNLAILNALGEDTFFAGLADLNVRLNGPNETVRLNGRADLVSASVSTFVSAERVSLERLKGTVIFTSNQAQVQNATGILGGGTVTLSGGAVLNEELDLDSFKLDLRGEGVTVPLPKNFLTSGDAVISVSGRRAGTEFSSFVSGRINARRSVFTENIELADVIGGRRDSPLASSRPTAGYGNIGLDVIVEGRDALVVRNNLADLTASLSLRVTGDTVNPQIAGRITANSGTIIFRYERYEVQRAELLFPPNTAIEPVVNLQAEAEIQGYQVFVNLTGSLSDMETLNATVRSNPALPQADVISLITTGSLANTEVGIPTTTQTGISTATDILADELLGKPISKATDRLFGLNRFELDPIVSGQRLNPTARLTVGRQVNRDLLVTYSTNLAQDQNQVLALEYRLSNRLSFVAQYEQRSLANVTQKANSFSFEIRLRKRF